MLFTLFIVNKAGGLIYKRDLNPVPQQSGNEYMRLASTFHSLHAISKQLAPVKSGGIEVIDAPQFSLYCFETPTGIKFFATARTRRESGNVPPAPPGVNPASSPSEVQSFLRKVYEFYADYVAKNPFYETDMPIRLRLFDAAVEAYVRSNGLGTGQGMDTAAASKAAAGSSSGGGPMFTGSSGASQASSGGGATPMFTGSSNS